MPLILSWGTIYPKIDLGGFYFDKVEVKLPKECLQNLSFELRILMLLYQRNASGTDLNQYLARCHRFLTKDFIFQLKQVGTSRESLEGILKKLPWQKGKIESIFRKTQKGTFQQELIETFRESVLSKESNVRKRINILKTLSQIPDHLIKDLVELTIALQTENQAWSKKIVKKIVNRDIKENWFSLPIETENLQKTLRETLFVFFENFNLIFKQGMLREMFVKQLEMLYPGENFNFNFSFWSANWDIFDLRNYVHSKNFGYPFAGFWYLRLLKAAHEEEWMEYLKNFLKKDNIKKYGSSFPWLFTLYPIKSFHSEILEIFVKLWKSGGSYNRFLVLELLEDSKLKKLISERIPELGKPLFQIKRNFYLKMIENGENLNFSIYQLLKLGDRSEEILWWVTFFEKQ